MAHCTRFLFILGASVLTAGLVRAPHAQASPDAAWRVRPIRVVTPPPASPGAVAEGRVRIEGVMSFSGTGTQAWLPPRCGAIDFFCRTGGPSMPMLCGGTRDQCEALCKMAWKDIELAASRGQCVAFALRLWSTPEHLVKPLDAPFASPNPFDPVLGVAIVPCQPESASDQRPDLSMACGSAATLDAGAPASGGSGGSGSGGTSGGGSGGVRGGGSGGGAAGAIGGTGGAGAAPVMPAPVAGASGAARPVEAPASGSCAVGPPGSGSAGTPLALLVLASLLSLLRRSRANPCRSSRAEGR